MNIILKVSDDDNVAVCLRDIACGEAIPTESGSIAARCDIPQFHKIALHAIVAGRPVLKYGQVIGLASADILPGDWVHVHNVESARGRGDKTKEAF